ncbi:MAG TPA: AAA family ATPase [Ktedonobacterales bacterium]
MDNERFLPDEGAKAAGSAMSERNVRLSPPPLTKAHSNGHKPDAPRVIQARRLGDIAAERITWVCQGYIPNAALSLSAAVGGAGKTHLNGEFLVRGAGGIAMPGGLASCLTGPVVVAIVTSENPASRVLRPQLEATARLLMPNDPARVQACLNNILVIDGVQTDIHDGVQVMEALSFPQDTEPLRQWIRANRVKITAFDPLISYTSSDVNVIDTLDVRHLLDGLAGVAESEDTAILGTVHFSKRTEGEFITRVSGSRQFTDTARSVFTVLVEKPDSHGIRRRWLASAKLNLGPTPRALSFTIDEVSHPAFPGEYTSVVTWDASVTRDAGRGRRDARCGTARHGGHAPPHQGVRRRGVDRAPGQAVEGSRVHRAGGTP